MTYLVETVANESQSWAGNSATFRSLDSAKRFGEGMIARGHVFAFRVTDKSGLTLFDSREKE